MTTRALRAMMVIALMSLGALAGSPTAEAARVLELYSSRYTHLGGSPGHPIEENEADNIKAAVVALGHTVTTIAGPDDPVGDCGFGNGATAPGTLLATAQEYSTALAAADVFLFPEHSRFCDLSFDLTAAPDVVNVWKTWVAQGGGLVISVGGEGMNKIPRLLEKLFGFHLTGVVGNGVTTHRTAAAATTLFSTAVTTLAGNSQSALITLASLPPGSASVYDDGTNSSVAILPFGAGKIVLLGWDWGFSDPPFPGEQNGGWFPGVLGAAIDEARSKRLTVTRAGTGSGTVHGEPAGIDAGIDCGAVCLAHYPRGASVTLTATAASSSTFFGWSGGGCSGTGPCTVTLGQDLSVTATFAPSGTPPPTMRRPPLDFDGDGRADVGVYRRSTGDWLIRRSSDGSLLQRAWGAPTLGDIAVPADYDGDAKTDVAVYRRATGEWFVLRSSDGAMMHLAWGAPALGDTPVPVDYDGDGKADIAVYRGSTGEWFIRRSTDSGLEHVPWGSPVLQDVPGPADYDGDGKADVAVYRGSTGEWFVLRSSDGAMMHLAWGAPALGDTPVPVDYDGDGKADVAVYRGSTGEWFIRRSTDGGLEHVPWGSPVLQDVPVPADYDGNGKADVAVYRGSTGEWFIRRSTDRVLEHVPWGSPVLQDVPVYRR